MSQNKTVFPGVGPEGDYNPNNGQGFSMGNQPNFRSNTSNRTNGTVCPGMDSHSKGTQRIQKADSPLVHNPSGKPIVGFLYSVSRTGIGEYWPIHIGQNLIGNSHDCDIVLGEGTVSFKHANLHINKMKKPEKIEATLSDLGSTNGTLLNENSVSVARPVECVNGDIITIGENYDLLLLLVDSKTLGLHLSENFIDIRDEYDEPYYLNNFPADGGDKATRNEQDFPPRFDSASSIHETTYYNNPYSGSNRPSDATVGMDTNGGGFRSGGTVGMD